MIFKLLHMTTTDNFGCRAENSTLKKYDRAELRRAELTTKNNRI